MTGKRRAPKQRPAAPPPSPAASPSAAERIRESEQSIRDRACDAKLRPRLTKNPQIWNQIVSSLDAIGDTEQALSAYLGRYPDDADSGSRYLFAYGVLHALYLQQDAVMHLSEAMGGRPAKQILGDKRIKAAREVRNRAVGHPTKKDRPKSDPVTTHQISRISLGQGGFDMLTADPKGKTQMEWVNVIRLIHDQREAVAEILEALDQELDREDREARRTFKDERLEELFPSSLGYSFEKLSEATRDDPHGILGLPNLDAIKGVMKAFAEALEKRGASYPGVRDWYGEIAHPLHELEQFFDRTASSGLHPETAAIVVEHLRQKIEELKHMATEIDEDWRIH